MDHGTECGAVSVQTLLASAKSLVTGLEQIEDEVRVLKKTGVPSGDRFIFVMKVRHGPAATKTSRLINDSYLAFLARRP